jgi:gliding motility-associated-like protein
MFLTVAMLFAVESGYSQGSTADLTVCVGTSSMFSAERSETGTVFDYQLKDKATDAVIFLDETHRSDSIWIKWDYPAGDYLLGVKETPNVSSQPSGVTSATCDGEWVWTEVRLAAPTPLIPEKSNYRLCGTNGVTIRLNESDFVGGSFYWSDPSIVNNLITQPGTYDVTATDLNGCESTATVTVASGLQVSLGNDTVMCSPEFRLFVLNSSVNPEGTTYTWWFSTDLTGKNGQLVKTGTEDDLDVYNHDNQADMLYWVHADYDDCSVGDTTVVLACPMDMDVNIPNTITPNGDGENDVWNIYGIGSYSNCDVEIFDRWGRRVFVSKKGYPTPWDGRDMNKKALPVEAYYYVIKLNDGKHTKPIVGVVHIIK